eukprot:TRINITY_DN43713_c0_g1_i1.p1 TRINITY_DN43713_c0_g1~~TRINITY_DN43713_c0_g1_i1.p1  ORF type:complete len:1369 (-),score=195.73 TRINITY_DN43713_c0_g1_i1:196-4302(-)
MDSDLAKPSSALPRELRQIGRTVDSVTLRFSLRTADGDAFSHEPTDYHVERFDSSSWFTQWTPIEDAQFRDKSPLYSVTVSKLPVETTLSLRVVVRGFPHETPAFSEACLCHTLLRPSSAIPLIVTERRPDRFVLEWLLADPEGAPVEECEVELGENCWMSSWRLVAGGLQLVEASGIDKTSNIERHRRWKCDCVGLESSTSFKVRARARNCIGWSAEWSPELVCQTSDVPAKATDLICDERTPESLRICFRFEDPVGAPVVDCQAEIEGLMGWKPRTTFFKRDTAALTTIARGAVPTGSAAKLERGSCLVSGLAPGTDIKLRLWLQNEAGLARIASAPLLCRTSDRPNVAIVPTYTVLSTQAVVVEWDIDDPEGAPVLGCELDYAFASFMSSWITVAAVSTGKALPRVSARHWKAELHGLVVDVTYIVRVRACNGGGWSTDYSPIQEVSIRSPPPPVILRAMPRPGSVLLRLAVDEVQSMPVTSLLIERSTLFSWEQVDHSDAVHVVADQNDTLSASTRCLEVRVELAAGANYVLRAHASNAAGRCKAASEPCHCHPADVPRMPSQPCRVGETPHGLVVEWHVPEPEGAPVWHCELQCREDSLFSTWQQVRCADTETKIEDNPFAVGYKSLHCRSTLEGLRSRTAYYVRVRARNEVGWSMWSTEPAQPFQTCGPPQPPFSAKAYRVPGTSGRILIFASVEDHPSAPVVACVVHCASLGLQIPAVRRSAGDCSSPGCWQVSFPMGDFTKRFWELVAGGILFGFRTANAIGWSDYQEYRFCEIPELDLAHAKKQNLPAVLETELLGLPNVVKEYHVKQKRIHVLQTSADAVGDDDHFAQLHGYMADISSRTVLLEDFFQRADDICKNTATDDDGAWLVTQFREMLQRPVFLPDVQVAVNTLELLLRGFVYLQRGWPTLLEPMIQEIQMQIKSSPESEIQAFELWISQREEWSNAFERRVCAQIAEGIMTMAMILAAVDGAGALEPFEATRKVIKSFYEMLLSSEQQLRRFRQSFQVLQQTKGQTGCHNFELATVTGKVGTTVLGILLTILLPLPGATELGAYRIGTLWLEDDPARRHVILQHPETHTGMPLRPALQRLGSELPPNAVAVLEEWESIDDGNSVLVHNACVQRITVTALAGEDGLATTAFSALSKAHPMISQASKLFCRAGEDGGVTVPPNAVLLLRLPETAGRDDRKAGMTAAAIATTSPEPSAPESGVVRLEFAYGPADHKGRPVGQARVRSGSALSFVCLDGGLHLSSCLDDDMAKDVVNMSPFARCVEVVNNGLTSVNVSLSQAAEKRGLFASALATETISPGKRAFLEISGLARDSGEQPRDEHVDVAIYEVEVCREDGTKTTCEVTLGQRVSVEG